MSTAKSLDLITLPTKYLPIGGDRWISERTEFAKQMIAFNDSLSIDFKMSVRGWCYTFENHGLITKQQFGYAQKVINECRKQCIIDPEFTAEDVTRKTRCIEQIDHLAPADQAEFLLDDVLEYQIDNYTPFSFWRDLDVYVEVFVEKIDLVGLFEPICERHRIPISNAKGWSDITSRSKMADRMGDMGDRRKVVLYFADFDPAGIFIQQRFEKNLNDLKGKDWRPELDDNFEVIRAGLNHDFILEHDLPWIDNLLTNSKGKHKDLSKPSHPSYKTYQVEEYIKQHGARKVEANALVVDPNAGRDLLQREVEIVIPTSHVDAYYAEIEERRSELRAEIG